MKLFQMNKDELLDFKYKTQSAYDSFKALGLSLDMSRGKPSAEQLDISMGMMKVLDDGNYTDSTGFDCRRSWYSKR